MMMTLMYIANIFVAGWISITSLFKPKTAQQTVFEGNFAYSEAIRLVGALWWGIFLISILGLFFPKQMSLIFLFQLIYKGSWLLFAAWPAFRKKESYPKGMTCCFILWILLLPFVIPWVDLFTFEI